MNQDKTFTINRDTAKTLFQDLIDADACRNVENIDHIREIMFNNIDSTAIENILTLMMMDRSYKTLNKGDYFITIPEKYDQGKEYEVDILTDMGLYHKSGQVYGIVKDDNSWDSNSYDPFYSRLKVDLLYHDNKGKLKKVEKTINPMLLKKVTKMSIQYFKNQEDAKT